MKPNNSCINFRWVIQLLVIRNYAYCNNLHHNICLFVDTTDGERFIYRWHVLNYTWFFNELYLFINTFVCWYWCHLTFFFWDGTDDRRHCHPHQLRQRNRTNIDGNPTKNTADGKLVYFVFFTHILLLRLFLYLSMS